MHMIIFETSLRNVNTPAEMLTYQSESSFIGIMTTLFCSAPVLNSDDSKEQVEQVSHVKNITTAVQKF